MNKKSKNIKYHRPRKRFGQNFLCDQNIIHNIVTAINPQTGEHIIEIGPGLGALTIEILKNIGQLKVIELDRDVIPKLAELCGDYGELEIFAHDALSFDFKSFGFDKIRVIGNLPYNISTPLIFHLLNQIEIIQDMHFMLQAEVVERLAAAPNTNAYGRLSVMVQYFCRVENLFPVPPNAFNPPPKVNSAVVRLIPHAELPCVANDFNVLQDLVRLAFNQRRKTIRNSMQTMVSAEQLESIGLDPKLRAENLTVEQFVEISNIC